MVRPGEHDRCLKTVDNSSYFSLPIEPDHLGRKLQFENEQEKKSSNKHLEVEYNYNIKDNCRTKTQHGQSRHSVTATGRKG